MCAVNRYLLTYLIYLLTVVDTQSLTKLEGELQSLHDVDQYVCGCRPRLAT